MSLSTGGVVRLRRRLWRVDAVGEHDFSATPLDGREGRRWRFLRSLEEPNLESGSIPWPNPSILSDPAGQDLLLRAYRLSLIHGSAPFLGLQRSRAIPEPYQLVPLLMAMGLERVRLLIGDDVGIGKSIEAGLVISELIARGDAERCLIVVPAGLRDQWQETLSRFFHIDSVIMAGHTRPALERQLLPGQSPWDAFPVVVASIDYLKRRIGEITSHRWDIVLFDEAHIAARPHLWGGSTQRDKERWELLQALANDPKVKHLLLLSATPHNGFTDSFASLIQVLNEKAASTEQVHRDVARRHVVQRRRIDLEEWYGHEAPLPRRVAPEIPPIGLSREESELLLALRGYGEQLVNSEHGTVGQWIALHLQRRALSSPGSIQVSLQKRLRVAKKHMSDTLAEHESSLGQEVEAIVLDMDSTSDLDDEARWSRLDIAHLQQAEDEVTILEGLVKLADKVKPAKDNKFKHLVDMLPGVWRRHPKLPRVLVFTRYKDTLSYLVGNLEKVARKKNSPVPDLSVFSIDGDMGQADRRKTFKEFESTDYAICVATDCISEGLDLQRACAELIHYELPWNPNRLEQRAGRIDRYGQPEEEVHIHTLVRDDALDATILEVLVRKTARIREEYGFCPPIVSSTGELKKLINRYGGAQQLELPFWADESVEDIDLDVVARERADKIVDESFYGQEEVRLPEVEAALHATYKTIGHPDEIEGFVRSALNHARASQKLLPDGTLEIDFTRSDLKDVAETMTVTFDPRIARDDPGLELIDLAHPLMRRLIESVLQEAAGRETGRIAVRGSKDVSEVTAVIHVLARYVTQSEQPVLMEELLQIAYKPYANTRAEGDPLALLHAAASTVTHTSTELQEMAAEALQMPGLEALIDETIAQHREKLESRQADLQRLGTAWATGMESLTVASKDVLTLTLLVPADA